MKTPQRFFCLGCFLFEIKVNRGYDIGSVDALAAISNDVGQITVRLPRQTIQVVNLGWNCDRLQMPTLYLDVELTTSRKYLFRQTTRLF